MSKSVKLSGGKYGLKESLISIKKKEIEMYAKLLSEREQGIETQSSQIAEIAESNSNKIAQIEKEYTIRIRNNDREHDQLVKELEAAKADLEVAKVELEKCSFLAVSKKKALAEDVEDLESKVKKLSNRLRINETTGQELIQARDKNISRQEGSNEVKNTIEEDKKDAEVLRESLGEKQQDLEALEAMEEKDIIKLFTDDEVLKEYIKYIIQEEKEGITFLAIQEKNAIFAALPDKRTAGALNDLLKHKKIDRVPNSDPPIFKSLEA